MPRTTPISHLMTTKVHALSVDARLSEVRHLLRKERCHHVPIVEGERLVGVVSSRDLVALLQGSAVVASTDIDALLDRSSLAEVMSRQLVTMEPDEHVERAIDLIADGAVHSVLVVDDRGRLQGIVTDTDLLAYLG